MKTFKDFVKEPPKKEDADRRDHHVWKQDDVEVHPEEKKDRKPAEPIKEDSHESLLAHLHGLPYVNALTPHELSPEEHDHFNRVHDKLNDSQYAHVSGYKSDSYTYNVPLREAKRSQGRLALTGRHDTAQGKIQDIHELSSALKTPTPRDMTVFKGVEPNAGIHRLTPGREFTDHGFTGASLHPDVAKSFSVRHDSDHQSSSRVPSKLHNHFIVARIHVPKGSLGHYLDVKQDGGLSAEKEFLMHRGTRFRVEGHSVSTHSYSDPSYDHIIRSNNPISHLHVVDLSVLGHHPKELVPGGTPSPDFSKHERVLKMHGFEQTFHNSWSHPEKGEVTLRGENEWMHWPIRPGEGNKGGTGHDSLAAHLYSIRSKK